MKLYLAGPMTGIPAFNYPAFDAAAAALRRVGHEVINPADVDRDADGRDGPPAPEDALSHRAYMRRDLPLVIECDGVVVLPGWAASSGARCEVVVALTCGLTVHAADWHVPQADEDGRRMVLATFPEGGRDGAWQLRQIDPLDAWRAMFIGAMDPELARDNLVVIDQPDPAPRLRAIDGAGERESVLAEAERLVNGPRQADYGHPFDDFSRTGRIWGALLGDWRDGSDDAVPPELVGLMMVGLKLSREVNKPGRDNLVDAAGYAGTVELVRARRAELDAVEAGEVARLAFGGG